MFKFYHVRVDQFAEFGRLKTTLAFAIEHDVLQETIGVIIVPVPDQPHIGLSELQDLLRQVSQLMPEIYH